MGNAQKPGAKAAETAALRAQRLSEQLRANLKRRKAAAKSSGAAPSDPETPSQTAPGQTGDAAD